MTGETIFDPKTPPLDRRRVERVALDGGVIYVKEMTAADALFCNEHALRRGGGPAEMRLDIAALSLWQVVCSCYRGKESGAARTFEMTDTPVIQALRAEEWNRLREAINRVNGLADEEVAALQDFTRSPADDGLGTSAPGASSTSTGFPVNSPTSAVPI